MSGYSVNERTLEPNTYQADTRDVTDEAWEALNDLVNDRDQLDVIQRWVAAHPTIMEDGDAEFNITLTITPRNQEEV